MIRKTTLTKCQKKTLARLRAGKWITANASGYFWPGMQRVRYATVEALLAAGLVKEIQLPLYDQWQTRIVATETNTCSVP